MKALIKKYKDLIYPVAVGVGSLILIVFVITPQLKGILEGRQTIQQTRDRINILEVKAVELEDLNEAELSTNLSLALYALPTDKDFNAIIGVFKELAASSGMSLVSLHSNSLTDAEQGFVVKAEVVGPTPLLGQFLEIIEKSPRIMRMRLIDASTTGGANLASASVSVTVYFAAAPSSLGAAEAVLPELTDKDQQILAGLSKTIGTVTTTATSAPAAPTIFKPEGKANPFE